MSDISNENKNKEITCTQRIDFLNDCLRNDSLSPDKLLEYVDEAQQIFPCVNDEIKKKELLKNTMKAYEKLELFEMAFKPLKLLMRVNEESNDIEGNAVCLKDMGILCLRTGNFNKAIEYNFKSLKIFQELGNNELVAVIYGHIGVVYSHLEDYENFLSYSNKAVEILREFGASKKLSTFLNNKGSALAYMKRFDEALACFHESLEIREKLDLKKEILNIYFNIGGIYKDKKDFDNAKIYYLKAEKLSLELGNPVGIAKSNHYLGAFYVESGEYEKAVEYMEKALNIFIERNLKPEACKAYEELSNAYVAMEDYKKAVVVYRNYIDLHKKLFDENLSKKVTEMQTKFETEKKIREMEILRTKNDELMKTNELLKEQSITDSLTGLYNPKTIYERLDEEIERARRHKTPLTILMVDLDNFKKVNDTFGHQTGDKILENIGEIIRDNIRKIDIAFRYGGEEFLVIFPATLLAKGITVVERLRKEIARINIGREITITMSGGLKEWEGENSFDYLYAVDKLLYKAKLNGKNRIEI